MVGSSPVNQLKDIPACVLRARGLKLKPARSKVGRLRPGMELLLMFWAGMVKPSVPSSTPVIGN